MKSSGKEIPTKALEAQSTLDMTEYDNVIKECRHTSLIKNIDYGSTSLVEFGNLGIVVRMSDKMARLKQLIKPGTIALVSDEKLEDTAKDLINYAAYVVMQCRGKLLKQENKEVTND